MEIPRTRPPLITAVTVAGVRVAGVRVAGAGVVDAPIVGGHLAGIGLTLLSVGLFAACNALAKFLVLRFPVGEMLFVRSVVAVLLIAPFLRRRDFAQIRAAGKPGLHLLRSLFSAIEVAGYYWAITLLPLADASTIYLAGPIYITALSAIFLREQVGWRRWAAVLIGFAGVLVALRPTGDAATALSPQAAVALCGSFLYAVSQVVTRRLRGTPTSFLVASQMAALLVLSIGSAAWGWVMPAPLDAAMMCLVGLLAMIAYFCANRALQLAPASVVAPFQYASIIGAIVLGYLVFAEIPAGRTLAGAAIIVAAGCFILAREKRRNAATSVLAPPP